MMAAGGTVKRILFICTGNTCRSPMAEALLKQKATEKGLDLEVRSAGVAAIDGMAAADTALQVMEERGIDHRSHRSQPITGELVEWADLILAMTVGHRQQLIQAFPEAADKLYTLKEYVLDDSQRVQLERLQRLKAEWQTLRAMVEKARADGDSSREESLNRKLESLETTIRKEEGAVWTDHDVADPFGGSLEIYRRCAEEIEQQLDKLLDRLQRS
ncbi:protein-tyrosine phosphatase [Melghirimyces thermohalophilus]|uniref:Protein-tyrosine phosphatase n=1 Tax=Melghirimyces thermohalophilus TaxID=1236220 RepID=A0A1G6MAV1_9BACL|nr:low molecular weight protein arginine phosphatase [Melghirimyces thermohalophilus]SDC52702.1 protein-tyrosine phosphatase [Melghirimyces thermohalophilus]